MNEMIAYSPAWGSNLKEPEEFIQQTDGDRYVEIPVYSEEPNEDGIYDIRYYRREYIG
jgi:hypothetical protein